MEAAARTLRKAKRRASQEVVELDYSHDTNLYLQPPDGTVHVDVLEGIVLDRARVLKVIDGANNTSRKKFSAEWRKIVDENLDAEGLRSCVDFNVEDKIEARRYDHLSHFTLMLAFHEDNQTWFVDVECDLFQLRLLSLSETEVVALLERHRDIFEITEHGGFYRVPFTDVPNLIRTMSVELVDGYAFVPTASMHEYVTSKFRKHIWKRMKLLRYCYAGIDEPRLEPIMEQLSLLQLGDNRCATFKASDSDVDVNIGDIEDLAKTNYPPCMRTVHEALKKDRHLKHGARMQYLYFLYGCGYSLDAVLEFWRVNFTGSMDEETFERKYSYFVKHTFGTVGRKRPARPLNCEDIIGEYVGPGQKHGCPFKVWSREALKERLTMDKIKPYNQTEIVNLCEEGQQQTACGNYFQRVHGTSRPNVIVHPNQYFADSLRLTRADKDDMFDDWEERLDDELRGN